jgi:hypothetical protein
MRCHTYIFSYSLFLLYIKNVRDTFSCFILPTLYLFLFCLACPQSAWAQRRELKEKSMVTGKNVTIMIEGATKDMTRTPMKKQPIVLYRRDSKGLSLDNLCVDQTMALRGMQYEIVPERHDISRFKYFRHNLWAEIKLWFNNGPFWKARMEREIQKCRELSGEYVED